MPIAETTQTQWQAVPGLRAYDIAILPRSADRTSPDCQGWCFGLPPGITPTQWPLDRRTGQPMRHMFTLLLPEGYRCKGPNLVAIAMFDSFWHADLSAMPKRDLSAVWDDLNASAPSDPLQHFVWSPSYGPPRPRLSHGRYTR
ncbi:MAG: hypothetical protein HC841_05030 [Verrucomicrobiae bacterium]|nr:hypothetical protein [Verrucomicrobiae bacterium]